MSPHQPKVKESATSCKNGNCIPLGAIQESVRSQHDTKGWHGERASAFDLCERLRLAEFTGSGTN